MSISPYYYAAVALPGVQLGIIRCDDVEFMAQHAEELVAKHQPNGGRLLIWNGAGMWSGPSALIGQLGRGFDFDALDWERDRLRL